MKRTIINIIFSIILLVSLGIIFVVFLQSPEQKEEKTTSVEEQKIPVKVTSSPKTTKEPEYEYFYEEGKTLEERLIAPKGYERKEAEAGSFTEFMRKYPLKPHKSPVLLYNGTEKPDQSAHVGIFQLEVGDKDLQQCADSIMRMYAEYYWELKQENKIAFHLTNGFLMEYSKWRDGYRLEVKGNQTTWKKATGYDDSYESFRDFLNMVFVYAGTLSLSKEATECTMEQIKPGDMFISGGSPGHCVMVVDMVENDLGKKAFLLAQGYMPAQEFHILKNPQKEQDPWYYEEQLTYPMDTPHWTFHEGSLKRWIK